METTDPDFAHTDQAEKRRREKATTLARYAWDRGISGRELVGLTDGQRRKFARAAGVNPPSGPATWHVVGELLDRKDKWARMHPDHPSATPARRDEKIMWIKPPIKPWTS